MKKLYASLMMVAAGAVVASAASFAPAQERFNDSKKYVAKELRSEKIVKNDSFAKKIKGRADVDAASLAGDYIQIAMPVFTNYEEMERTSVVNVTVDGNKVSLNGLFGWNIDDLSAAFEETAAISGTLEGNVITINAEQNLGTYNGMDMLFLPIDDDFEFVESMTITIDENGKLVGSNGGVVVAVSGNQIAGYYAGNDVPTCARANGSITYESSMRGDEVTIPLMVEELTDEAGTQIILSSTDITFEGYLQYFEVEDGLGYADDLLADSNSGNDPALNFYLVAWLEIEGKQYYTQSVTIGVAENEIKYLNDTWTASNGNEYPVTGWSLYDVAEGYWRGENTCATISYTTAGVNNIVADSNNADAPVEYYNLQGMKINNPGAGQVIIKRQGNKTIKYIAR